jgi:hypothetical protein
VQNQSQHKFLSAAHKEKWISNFKLVPLKPVKVLKKFNDWRDECVIWFNNWVTKPYQYKRKQLYLYGPASTGKSTFIQRVLFAQYGGQVFKANSSDEKYCWENFNQKTHNLVTIDEFSYKDHNINTLKLVLAGEDFICPIKYQDAQLKFVQCPVVIISNHPPPVFNEPFMERIQVIDTEPLEDQEHGAYVDFFEFLDLWQYQEKLYNYETDVTESMQHNASLFNSEQYKKKVSLKNASESTIVIEKRKAHEAFNSDEEEVSSLETPAPKKRIFTFKKSSQNQTQEEVSTLETPAPKRTFSFKKATQQQTFNPTPITSTPITSQLDSEDDDFQQAKRANAKFSLQDKIKKMAAAEEIRELVDETLAYILE